MCLPTRAKIDEVTTYVQYAAEELHSRLAQKLAELLKVMKVDKASLMEIPKLIVQFKPSYAPAVADYLTLSCSDVLLPFRLRSEQSWLELLGNRLAFLG